MKRILITGISAVGKSSVIEELARCGYYAVDLDNSDYSQWSEITDELAQAAGTPVETERDWVWREDRVAALLDDKKADLLFVSGCAPNMGKFRPFFDQVILLTAPDDITVQRLQTRTNNPYGKAEGEEERVLDLKVSVEPLLRQGATHEIETDISLECVVREVLKIAQVPV
jgi:dephospho-CoA kinase